MTDDPQAPEGDRPNPAEPPAEPADHEIGTVELAVDPTGEADLGTDSPQGPADAPTRPSDAAEEHPAVRRRGGLALHLVLLLLTFLSAAWTQLAVPERGPFWDNLQDSVTDPLRLWHAAMFAGTLVAILIAHEFGHYLTARASGVRQSLPYFIPAPTLLGTLGAVVLLRSQPRDRGQLLWVAVAGPFVGLMPALAATIWGLGHSTVSLGPEPGQTYALGSSLLFAGLQSLFGPDNPSIALHPVAFAGWVGLFVTSLNLIPAAQLDGGHIAYALLGKRQRRLAVFVVAGLVLLGVTSALGTGPRSGSGGLVWLLWAVLLFVIGLQHPPVRDEARPLSKAQLVAGILAMALFVVTFVPLPISSADPDVSADPDSEVFLLPPPDPRHAEEPALRPGAPWPAEEFEL